MPGWVQLLPLLIVVIVLAVRMMRPQRISVTRMWVSPIILCALTAFAIYANNMRDPAPPLEIALGVVLGAIVGLPFGILRGMHTDVRPTDRKGVMYLGSSWVTIVIFAAAFGLRYAVRMVIPHRGSLTATIGDALLAFAIVFIGASYFVIFRKYEELAHKPAAEEPTGSGRHRARRAGATFCMKTALYGRIVFGGSAVLFGVIALMWHDADTWQSLHRILRLPFGTLIGEALMVALIAGGIGILFPRALRPASIVLAVVYAVFSLVCVAGIFAAPRVFGQYDGFFEQFCLLCGAIALYAITAASAAQSATLRLVARLGLGLCMVSFTLAQIIYLGMTVSLVPKWIPPNQMFWAILTTVAFALAAIAMLINIRARLAMRLMAVMLTLFGLLVWVPLLVAHPEVHGNWSEFALNFLIAGATWMVADAQSG